MISLRDLLFQVFFRMGILATMIHEYGHLLALRLMGYRGAIYSNALNMTTAIEYNLLNYTEQRIFFISGGLFQGIIFLIMCIFDKDEENRIANKMTAIQGFVYMVFEAFTFRMWWEIGAVLGVLASFAFMVLVLNAKSSQAQ